MDTQQINEDFNSGNNFILDVYSSVQKKTTQITVFFEKVPFPKKENEFNLIRYLKSFQSSARDIMDGEGKELDGLLFPNGKDLLIFTFYSVEHEDVCSALDNNPAKGTKYPTKRYLQTYNNMYLEFDIPKNWCFAFEYDQGKLISNFPASLMRQFNKQFRTLLGLS